MSRYRRYIIAGGVLVVLLGLYAVAGFWAVPHFARSSAQDFVRTHYGRQLAIGEIRFNPFTLKLDIGDLALPDADGKTLLSFAHLHVDLQYASIWRLGPSFKEILLDKPYVRAVIRHGGELNLADLGKGFPPPKQPAPPPPKNEKPMRLYIGRLAVTGGSSTFEDLTRADAFKADFNPITFELRDFSTVGSDGNHYALTAASEDGEQFDWSGDVRLAPLTSQGQFAITTLKARTLWDYVRDIVPLEIDSGLIDVHGGYQLAAGDGPLSLKVAVHDTTVTDLGIKPKGGPEDYLKLGKIEVLDTQVDVAAHKVDIGKVALTGGDLRAWLDEHGRLNLIDLAPPTPAAASAAPAKDPAATDAPAPVHAATSGGDSTPWVVSAPDIGLNGFKIGVEDRQVKPALALTVDPLNVHVGGFNTRPDDVLEVSIDSTVNGSGKLGARAKVTPKSGDLTAHVEASALALPFLQPYLSRYTSMTLLKGALGARLDLTRRADGYLEVKGGTQLSGLKTVDNAQKRDFVSWKDLKVDDILYRSQPQSLRIRSVTAVEPYARMIIFPNRALNISEVLKPAGSAPPPLVAANTAGSAAPAPATPPPAAPPPPVAPKARKGRKAAAAAPPAPPAPATPFPMAINTIRIVNATLDYTDLWIKPSFAVGIQTLSGTITGLSSDPKSRAKIELNGKVDRYSPAHIGGEANLLSAVLYTDIAMSFKDIDLTIVNPYSGHFIGYKIDKGKLSVDVSYKVDQRKLDAKQHFVVDQLELGDRVESPDAIHAPVKLAVALLKDRNGVIDIDLPMNGSIDDPQFRIGPLIWKVFVNLIVKAATAPFALLGHLFGGGEHMNIVEFDPGSAQLDKGATDQLGALAKSLKERPQLKLDVPITYSRDLDAPHLAAKKVEEELDARVAGTRAGKKNPQGAAQAALADPQQHYRLLLEQFRATLGKDAPLPDSAQAVENAKRKESPPYEAAIKDLEAALTAKVEISDADLVSLGKDRARAIQDALLSDGQIEPARVFIVDTPPKTESGARVKAELAVK
ncbi:MAG: DUF748 domain-containing protein [Proteobacteria bacterium]|nr:DUF748 domain-containing protein [Pseudomonadota bacterium]